MHTIIVSLMLLSAPSGEVTTSENPDTMLYVRTTPAGAEVLLDGKPLGKTDGLFPVEPGEYTIVIDLEGHQPEEQTITLRDGRIKRIELKLKPAAGDASAPGLYRQAPPWGPQYATPVPGHDSSEPRPPSPTEVPTLPSVIKRVPKGWHVFESERFSPEEIARLVNALKDKLGRRLDVECVWVVTFSALGKHVQVNVLQCGSEADAEAIRKAHGEWTAPLCVRQGTTVITLSGSFDKEFAKKAADELLTSPDQFFHASASGERVEVRKINKKIADFPEAVDLSTPESACAAFHRACARMDADAVVELSWVKINPAEMKRFWENAESEDLTTYNQAQLDAEILEVIAYRGDLAAVISKLQFPPGVGRHPYSFRSFGRIFGEWKNLGEDRCASLKDAEAAFAAKKEHIWEQRARIEAERAPKPDSSSAVQNESGEKKPAAVLELRIAPVERPDGPEGISLEEIVGYREEFQAKGPAPESAPGTDFRWFPMQAKAEAKPDLITASHDGREYVLLSNRPQETIVIGQGDAYDGSLAQVGTVWTGGTGRPSIHLEFDDRASKRLDVLSRAYLLRPLAVVVDGQVVFCPKIQSPISKSVSITGDFTAAEVDRIVEALRSAVNDSSSDAPTAEPSLSR